MRSYFVIFLLFAWLVLPQLGGGGVIFAGAPATLTALEQNKTEPGFLSISDEMIEFLDKHIMIIDNQNQRLRVLIESIFDRSVLNFEYSNNRTYTAAQAFAKRTGNCLSYTAMLVVMARYVGIPAYFQEVYDFSHWTQRGNVVVFNRHMNAVVVVEGRRIEVDFDFSTDRRIRRTRVVNDQRAQAHYYNNIGAEALIEKKYARAELRFKKAIDQDETFSPSWTNLGLLYQYKGNMSLAEQAYKKAIQLDKEDYTAQMNLAKLYKIQGKVEQAEKIKKQVEKYCRKNPFYHYSLGQSAFEQAKFGLAIQHFKRAIRRNAREPEFYARVAAAYYKQGNSSAAEKYLKKAGKLANSHQQRIRYNRKLNYLYSHSNLKR